MEISLLAPVPAVMLRSLTDEGRTEAVFGTRAVDVLKRLDDMGGVDIEVLLYASHADAPAPFVTWTAQYDCWLPAEGNLVPKRWQADRPLSAATEDRSGGWFFAYYRVTGLTQLADPLPLAALRAAGSRKRLAITAPEGLLLVERP